MNHHLLRQRDQLDLFVRWKIADGSTLQEASELEFAFSLLVTWKNTSVIWPSSFSYSTLSNRQLTYPSQGTQPGIKESEFADLSMEVIGHLRV